MSVDILDSGRIVHYPKRRNVFSFDEEVSRIFPDMAMRSIPMYAEAHRLHLSMFRDALSRMPSVVLYDVGASRGDFFRALCNQLQIDPAIGDTRLHCTAIDNSWSMLSLLHSDMPWVDTVLCDVQDLVPIPGSADFISMFYILQFLRTDAEKLAALRWAYASLKPGGVLFLGQKDLTTDVHTEQFAEEYYRFRMDNDYSLEEIRAKTLALKNSMWPIAPGWLNDLCVQAGFMDYVETTRWLTFSTSMCIK